MAQLTPEQDEHVQYLLHEFERKGADRSEAIEQVHLFVCKGACSWYKNHGGTGTAFDAESQTPEQREEIGKRIDQVAQERGVTREDLMKWFHVFRCHS